MKIYIIYSVPAQVPYLEKKIVLEKLFSFNEMAGFFNEPDLQNKSMK